MTNSYLICEAEKNSFTVNASAEIDGTIYRFPIKIDTGCTHSVLPFRMIANVTKRESYRSKKNDIKNKLHYVRSYGVSDTDFTKTCDRLKEKIGLLKRCRSLKFLHKGLPMFLNGVSFISDMYINYDRTSNPLFGLDALQQFTFTCDVSIITGKYTFIGCPREQADKTDFYYALIRHFGCIKVTNL